MRGGNLEWLGAKLRRFEITGGIGKFTVQKALHALHAKGAPLEVVSLMFLARSPRKTSIIKFVLENFATLKALKVVSLRDEIANLTRVAPMGLIELVLRCIDDVDNDWSDSFYPRMFSQRLPKLRKLKLKGLPRSIRPRSIKIMCENCPSLKEFHIQSTGKNFMKHFNLIRSLHKLYIQHVNLSKKEMLNLMTSFRGKVLAVNLMIGQGSNFSTNYTKAESIWILKKLLTFLRSHTITKKKRLFKIPLNSKILKTRKKAFKRLNVDLESILKPL